MISFRKSFNPAQPYRKKRPVSDKIIFLSCEGAVTEEEYFFHIMEIFSSVKSRIQFISVKEDILFKKDADRTIEEKQILSKSSPADLVSNIDSFKEEKNDVFDFSLHPEDEFWIVADVDHHTDTAHLNGWNKMIAECDEKGYGYAVSNPFFEVWLLLHFDDVSDEDRKYAVTPEHQYEKTAHFRERLRALGSPLRKEKHIREDNYTRKNVAIAVERAKSLDKKYEKWPRNIGSTVYKLIEKIIKLDAEIENTDTKTRGVRDIVWQEIKDFARQYDIDKVVLFGSRARGDYKKTSDIDLAVWGGNIPAFMLDVDEETSTLLNFDIVNMDRALQPELIESIAKEGVVIYEKV